MVSDVDTCFAEGEDEGQNHHAGAQNYPGVEYTDDDAGQAHKGSHGSMVSHGCDLT